jgi:hypothetical protein
LHSDMSVKSVIGYTLCVLQLYKKAEDLGKHEAVRELAPLVQMHLNKMLTAGRQFESSACSSLSPARARALTTPVQCGS